MNDAKQQPMISIRDLSKQYFLGEFGSGTLYEDLQNYWRKLLSRKTADDDQESESDFWALQEINLDIAEGEVIGIIGKNGAGKSTLLKILSQITKPTTGEIVLNGRVSSLLEVGTGFHPDLTGRENVFLNGAIMGMTKKEIRAQFDDIVAFSGCEKHIDTPIKRYSSGMTVRLGFSVAAHLQPEILIVDEVLAVGDLEFQDKCLGKMHDISTQGRTVLFVSHNMQSILKLCKRAVLLDQGRITMIGETQDVVEHYINLNSKTNLEEGEVVIADDVVGLRSIEMLNSIDAEYNVFDYKTSIDVQLNYQTQTDISDLKLSVVVRNFNEEIIFASWHTDMPGEARDLRDFSYARCQLPAELLKPGLYKISCLMHRQKSGKRERIAERSLRFKIVDESNKFNVNRAGVIQPAVNWQFDSD